MKQRKRGEQVEQMEQVEHTQGSSSCTATVCTDTRARMRACSSGHLGAGQGVRGLGQQCMLGIQCWHLEAQRESCEQWGGHRVSWYACRIPCVGTTLMYTAVFNMELCEQITAKCVILLP